MTTSISLFRWIRSPTSTSMIKIRNTIKFVYLSRLLHLNGLVVTMMMTGFFYATKDNINQAHPIIPAYNLSWSYLELQTSN